ncbi:HD family phosphohydrolase [Paenibacillus sp. UMB4589-SE434]|uniref:HD family phosphohydrolase n=1 Tax=Paenibacillus sp. UMB4589-SE434 TaxID=3046314 RepID=UPI00254F3DBF|nr:HD family phosphohydrolase [Paenibacillus sp. UMB4589-SE434]MDK8183058.1 HD family phosphohydrolase [Paenibacillus sp. UMB4589-SE434]
MSGLATLLGIAGVFYGIPLIGLIILIIIGKKVYDKRYKQHDNARDAIGLNADYVPTKEIFIDPRDGFQYQVYYNPKTGDRQYIRTN